MTLNEEYHRDMESMKDYSELPEKLKKTHARRGSLSQRGQSWVVRHRPLCILLASLSMGLWLMMRWGGGHAHHKNSHGAEGIVSHTQGMVLISNFESLMDTQVELAGLARPPTEDTDFAAQIELVRSGISQLSKRVESSNLNGQTRTDILGRLVAFFERLDLSKSRYLEYMGQMTNIMTTARQLTMEKIAWLEAKQAVEKKQQSKSRLMKLLDTHPILEEELQDLLLTQAAMLRHYLQETLHLAQQLFSEAQSLQIVEHHVGEVPAVHEHAVAGRYKNSLVAILAMTGGGPRKIPSDRELAKQLNAAAKLRGTAEQALSPVLVQLQNAVVKLDGLHYRVKQQQQTVIRTDITVAQILKIFKEGLEGMGGGGTEGYTAA